MAPNVSHMAAHGLRRAVASQARLGAAAVYGRGSAVSHEWSGIGQIRLCRPRELGTHATVSRCAVDPCTRSAPLHVYHLRADYMALMAQETEVLSQGRPECGDARVHRVRTAHPGLDAPRGAGAEVVTPRGSMMLYFSTYRGILPQYSTGST